MKRGTDGSASLLSAAAPSIVLTGPPRAIRGEFTVRNSTAQKIVVQQPTLKAQFAATRVGKQSAKTAALPEATFALRRIIARPMAHRSVPIALTLDPGTPPGTYEAQLEVDGETRPVVVHVTEDVDFSMTPDSLIIPNRAGEKFHKQVVFTNNGNVPLNVKSIGPVVLDDEIGHCRAIRGALSDVGTTMKSLDDFVVALGKRYSEQFETTSLKVQNEKVTIAPGETRAVELTITVPEKLNARARYSGYAAISRGSLTFTVVPD
jgi:hypothetical protein